MSDEYDFWGDISLSASRLQARERAQKYQEILESIARDFSTLESLSQTEVLEQIQICEDCLDDLWKCTDITPLYPEKRMVHLLEIISSQLTHYVQNKLSALDIWKGPYSTVHTSLHEGLLVCEKWTQSAEQLTSRFWKQFALHQWKGDKFSSRLLNNFIVRLEQVCIVSKRRTAIVAQYRCNLLMLCL